MILIHNMPEKIFNASTCGDNCAKWILRMADERDITINLRHLMDFGPDEFEIRRNITIIRGDSATGKTTLIDMIREYDENGEDSGIELVCEKTCSVLEGRNWKERLSLMEHSILFIDEGNAFVASKDSELKNILREPWIFIDSEKHASWERFFTTILTERTENTYLRYNKKKDGV